MFVFETSAQRYKVAITENPPLVYSENHTAKGLFVELLEYVASKEGWELEYVFVSFPESYKGMIGGKIDICQDIGYSKQRTDDIRFNEETVISAWAQVYIHPSLAVENLKFLDGKKIAVQDGDFFVFDPQEGIKQYCEKFGIKCEFVLVDNYHQVFTLIEEGKVDAGVVNRIFGEFYFSDYKIKRTNLIFSPVSLRYGFSKYTSVDVIQKLDKQIKNLKESNSSFYYNLLDKYFSKKNDKVSLPFWILYLGVFAVLLILFLFIITRYSQKQIERKTNELKLTNLLLATNEKKYRLLFETSRDGLLIMKDNTIVDCNNSAIEIFESGRDKIIGKKLLELSSSEQAHGVSSDRELQRRIDLANQGNPQTFEWLHTKISGMSFYCEDSINLIEISNEQYLQVIIRDIDDRKIAEEALLLSENKHRTLIKALPDIILVLSVDGKIVDYSVDDETKLAMPGARVKGNNIRNLGFSEKELRKMLLAISETLQFNRTVSVEYELNTPYGSSYWDARMSPLDKENVVAVIRDISERKDAENQLKRKTNEYEQLAIEYQTQNQQLKESHMSMQSVYNELQESEEKFRNFLEQTSEGVSIVNQVGDIIEWNRAAESIYEMSKNEVIGKKYWEIQHALSLKEDRTEEKRKMLQITFEKFINTHQSPFFNKHLEFEIETKSGRKWIQSITSPITVGEYFFLGSTARDISERKASEEELRRLARVTEQLTEMVVITDTEFVVQYVNKAYEKITGYSDEQSLNKMLSFVEEDDAFRDEIANQMEWTGQIEARKKNGMNYILSISVTTLKNELGNAISYVLVGNDITQQKKIDERLRQSQKLEAMGTLAGGIAHDFNNLLTPIQGYSILLEDELKNNDQAYNDLQQIKTAANRAKNLVSQILTFGRKVDAVNQDFELQKILQEAAVLVKYTKPSDVVMEMDLPEETIVINGNASQMHQVVINVMNNAFHAMEKGGGKLEVSLKFVLLDDEFFHSHPRLDKDNDYVRLSFRDSGEGITKDNIDRIFEPFFTTKEKSKGTGLGLSIVHSIISSHGGDISVYSELGVGTAIHIYLPGKLIANKNMGDITERAAAGNHENILVLDDEEAVLTYTSRVLNNLNYNVIPFSDPKKALEFIRESSHSVDLIITDFSMPAMSGSEFSRQVKLIHKDLPVILMTGLILSKEEESGKMVFADLFIRKPFTQLEISKSIAKALHSQP